MSDSITATLNWFREIGVNSLMSEMPTNNFTASVEKLGIEKQTPQKPKTLKPISDKVQQAIDSAQKATSIQELKTATENFDGCNLKQSATNMVFADGDPKADIMLIGEAPGSEEDAQGLPFVGSSGQLLETIFKTIGYERANLYITNIIPWRPPGNRAPTTQEIAMYKPFVEKHIELVDPKVIVLLGGTAVKSLLDDKDGIMKLRGQFIKFHNSLNNKDYETFTVYHPSFLLRSPGQKRKMWQDMLILKNHLKES